MDRLKDSAFDNLIAELRKKSFKGSPIDFTAFKSTARGYRCAHEIEILFKSQPAFRDLDPNPYTMFTVLVREYMSYAKLFLVGTDG